MQPQRVLAGLSRFVLCCWVVTTVCGGPVPATRLLAASRPVYRKVDVIVKDQAGRSRTVTAHVLEIELEDYHLEPYKVPGGKLERVKAIAEELNRADPTRPVVAAINGGYFHPKSGTNLSRLVGPTGAANIDLSEPRDQATRDRIELRQELHLTFDGKVQKARVESTYAPARGAWLLGGGGNLLPEPDSTYETPPSAAPDQVHKTRRARTAIGFHQAAPHIVALVTIDEAHGVTIPELADVMRQRRVGGKTVDRAMAFDGGTSTTLWEALSDPSGKQACPAGVTGRKVPTVLLVKRSRKPTVGPINLVKPASGALANLGRRGGGRYFWHESDFVIDVPGLPPGLHVVKVTFNGRLTRYLFTRVSKGASQGRFRGGLPIPMGRVQVEVSLPLYPEVAGVSENRVYSVSKSRLQQLQHYVATNRSRGKYLEVVEYLIRAGSFSQAARAVQQGREALETNRPKSSDIAADISYLCDRAKFQRFQAELAWYADDLGAFQQAMQQTAQSYLDAAQASRTGKSSYQENAAIVFGELGWRKLTGSGDAAAAAVWMARCRHFFKEAGRPWPPHRVLEPRVYHLFWLLGG